MPLNLPAQPHIYSGSGEVSVLRADSPSSGGRGFQKPEDPEVTKNRQLQNVLLEKEVSSYDQDKADKKLLNDIQVHATAWSGAWNVYEKTGDSDQAAKAFQELGGDGEISFSDDGETMSTEAIDPNTGAGISLKGKKKDFKMIGNTLQAIQADPKLMLDPTTQQVLRDNGISMTYIKPSDSPAQAEERDKRMLAARTAAEKDIINTRNQNYLETRSKPYENPDTGERINVLPGQMPKEGFYPIGSGVVSGAAKDKTFKPFGLGVEELDKTQDFKLTADLYKQADDNFPTMPGEDPGKYQQAKDEFVSRRRNDILGIPDETKVDTDTQTVYERRGNKFTSRRATTQEMQALGMGQQSQKPEQKPGLSIKVSFDGGKEVDIPLLVPTLSKDQADYLSAGGKPTHDMIQKAMDYAKERINAGKSPFAEEGEGGQAKPDQSYIEAPIPKTSKPQETNVLSKDENMTIGDIPFAIVKAFKEKPTASEAINAYAKAMSQKGVGFTPEDIKKLGKWLVGKTDAQKERALEAATRAKQESDAAWQKFLSTKIPIKKGE